MDRKYIPLFLIFLFNKQTGESFISKTKLVKIIYEAKKKFHLNVLYGFKDDHFGPNDDSISMDLDACVSEGLLTMNIFPSGNGRPCYFFNSTQEGILICNKIEKELGSKKLEIWNKVALLGKARYEDILKQVYSEDYKNIDQLRPEIENIKSDINGLYTLISNSQSYDNYDKQNLLFFLSYISKLLEKKIKEKSKLNIIFAGVRDLVFLIKDSIKNQKIDPEIFDLFGFIESNSVEYKLLSSLDSDVFDADEFLSEGEQKWLLQMTKQ